jgi:hypothetical protein
MAYAELLLPKKINFEDEKAVKGCRHYTSLNGVCELSLEYKPLLGWVSFFCH